MHTFSGDGCRERDHLLIELMLISYPAMSDISKALELEVTLSWA